MIGSSNMKLEDVKKLVLEKVDQSRDKYINLLREVIRIPSPNPPGNEEQVADYCAAFLRQQGMDVQLIEPFKSRKSNIARLRGSRGSYTLLFNSHLDTVAPGDLKKWKYDPFSGEIAEGCIWGLGAKNMKAGMVAAMSAVHVLREIGIQLDGDLLIVQAADEMQGGLKGLKVIMEKGLVKADSAIYTECDLPVKVEIAHRGLVQLDIIIHGRTAHTTETSAQHGLKPINAIKKMALVIPAISGMKFTNWQPHQYIPGEPIISPNMIWGGHAENLVADKCTIRCDCRTLPPQTTQSVIEDVRSVLEALKKEDPEFHYDIELYNEANSSMTEPSALVVRTVQRAFQEVTGRELPVGGVKTTSDARWLREAGIPTCKFSKISGRSGTNEFIEIDDYLTTIRVYLLVILYLLYNNSKS